MTFEGGTGSALIKDITNGDAHQNCYNYSTLSRKVILKAYKRSSELLLYVPTNDIISSFLYYFKFYLLFLYYEQSSRG
jgi:hypothetical protein